MADRVPVDRKSAELPTHTTMGDTALNRMYGCSGCGRPTIVETPPRVITC